MTIERRFCYSRRWNDHWGYPRSLAGAPPRGWSYRPASISMDPRRGRPWCRFHARDGEIIHASSLIPTNRSPWVLDTDHAAYLLLQTAGAFNGGRRKVPATEAARGIARALASPRCAGVLAWSAAARDSIVALCEAEGVAPPRTSVVYPAVAPPDPAEGGAGALASIAPVLGALSPGSVRFLMVDGQIGVCARPGRKNLAAGVRCVRELRRRGVDAELVVVAPSEPLFRDEPWLHVLPHIPRAALWALYGAVDVLLFLSRQDSFGYVILEAMHHGLCCIAATGPSVPAVGEILAHGETGLLLPSPPGAPYPAFSRGPSHHALLEQAYAAATDAALRRRIGAAARRETRDGGRFSPEHRNAALERVLRG
ncbi:MAG TPA: glycosyltransferase family 4 protein [Longimicrobium sp.]|nr:glycosyltransferase family 4 protein [Longimicrobium sp.]